ncbi:hypothetical protein HDE69_002873 [Pedobacter cryoconitis]|uniref:Uncharacterized protein n=1 Tax=Pedobacter cryoconitis TaxID=188932 RepID=A0A7W8YUM6_9SPHI|nr:class I lanthipeptide [Pedobacter cryoconitis]MBB5621810.1 hypothetical protein [Pedobacter cryoconitis]MBB5644065.1 hypothetical protein [Pedobacter cryoconitis]
MKKIKLNSERLRLKKEKVASLTTGEMSKIYGGVIPPITLVTRRICCEFTDIAMCGVEPVGN